MKPGTMPFLKRMLVDGEIFPAAERFLGFVRAERSRLGVAEPEAPAEPRTIDTVGEEQNVPGPSARQGVPR